MRPIAEQLGQLTRLEELAGQNSPIHRLHPGAKLAATGVYLLCVLSLGFFLLFWPVLSGSCADESYIRWLQWLPGWSFGA